MNKKSTLLLLGAMIWLMMQCAEPNSSQESAISEVDRQFPTTLTSEEEAQYLKQGKQVVGATFSALSSSLMKAMQEGGVPRAVTYCQVNALPITDSLAVTHQARIKRTSNKIRNPKNAPTSLEISILADYQKAVDQEGIPQPRVALVDQQTVAYYAPIFIMEPCLKCHGQVGKTISQEDYTLIQSKYPEDQATNYQLGALRGIWSVELNRESL